MPLAKKIGLNIQMDCIKFKSSHCERKVLKIKNIIKNGENIQIIYQKKAIIQYLLSMLQTQK